MEHKISVIINIYNLDDKYVLRSINSVSNQKYKNFECLIIDDGSEKKLDKKILNRLDSRFKYIYTENKGISCARNLGIEKSTGDILFFLDGDDFLSCNQSLNIIAEAFEKDNCIDFLHYNFSFLSKKKEPLIDHNDFYVANNNKFEMKLTFFQQLQGIKCAYKREFLHKNNIRFPDNRIRNEDVYFHLIAKTLSKKIGFTKSEIYSYDDTRQDSISHIENKKNVYKEFIMHIFDAYNFLKSTNNDISMFYLHVIYYEITFLNLKEKDEFSKELFVNNIFLDNKIGVGKANIFVHFLWKRNFFIRKIFISLYNSILAKKIIKIINHN